MKILVADDDQVSLMMIRRMLLQCGYEVTTATDGMTAVESVLQEDGPRLLLLDWMMPVLNGPEVCKAIRSNEHRAYVYIVLLTSRDSKEDLVAGLKAGADDYVIKPCHLEELRARLHTGERILQLEDNLIRAREEMRFGATHDALTLLLNRGAIVQALRKQMDKLCSSGNRFSVLLCDVDHFKRINDTHGHPVGDEVLREVARRLGGANPPGDAVGRFGGEEFLCVFPHEGTASLASRARSVCDRIRSRPIETSAGPLRVTMSAGALTLEASDFDISVDNVLRRVDSLLYQAKKQGRDRAVVEAGMDDAPMGLRGLFGDGAFACT